MITHCFQCKARLIDQRTCPNGCEQNPIIIQLNNKDKTIAELRQKLAVAKSIKHRRDIVVWIAEYCWKKANPDSKFSEPPSMLYEQVEKDFFAWLDSTEKAEQEER